MGGTAFVVDYVGYFAEIIEGYGDHVVKPHIDVHWSFNCACEYNIGMTKDAVNTEAPGFVVDYIVCNLVGSPAVGAGRGGVGRLIGRVIGDFRLIEVGSAIIAVPQDLELLVVLDEEDVSGHAVDIDDETVVAEIACPSDASAAACCWWRTT